MRARVATLAMRAAILGAAVGAAANVTQAILNLL
jgi:hypothetical protein